jgi:hypothetical protein
MSCQSATLLLFYALVVYISLKGNSDQDQGRVEVVSQGGYDGSSDGGSINGMLYQP